MITLDAVDPGTVRPRAGSYAVPVVLTGRNSTDVCRAALVGPTLTGDPRLAADCRGASDGGFIDRTLMES